MPPARHRPRSRLPLEHGSLGGAEAGGAALGCPRCLHLGPVCLIQFVGGWATSVLRSSISSRNDTCILHAPSAMRLKQGFDASSALGSTSVKRISTSSDVIISVNDTPVGRPLSLACQVSCSHILTDHASAVYSTGMIIVRLTECPFDICSIMFGQLLQACVLTLAGVALWAFNPVKRFRYRHIPGPTPAPLLGNLPQVCTPTTSRSTSLPCWSAVDTAFLDDAVRLSNTDVRLVGEGVRWLTHSTPNMGAAVRKHVQILRGTASHRGHQR